MMKHTIITIGRQFGSGGHEVGNRLAERLDIPLYDHNLIRMAAQELRISSEDATQVDDSRKISHGIYSQYRKLYCIYERRRVGRTSK